MDGVTREPSHVIIFEEAGLGALGPSGIHESAAAFVALEDGSPDPGGGASGGGGGRVLGLRRAGILAEREALLLDAFDEEVERFLQDRRRIAVGNAMAEQGLGATELVVHSAARGELHFVRVFAERRDQGVRALRR